VITLTVLCLRPTRGCVDGYKPLKRTKAKAKATRSAKQSALMATDQTLRGTRAGIEGGSNRNPASGTRNPTT
jgi:hypothetical protein